jgi:hypothetical protein
MEEGLIVEGQRFVTLLDGTPARPRGAVWVQERESRWRLWVVPAAGLSIQEFHTIAAGVFAANGGAFTLLDSQCVVVKPSEDPAIRGFRGAVRMEGLGSAQFIDCKFNGVAIPDCYILRMAL